MIFPSFLLAFEPDPDLSTVPTDILMAEIRRRESLQDIEGKQEGDGPPARNGLLPSVKEQEKKEKIS